MKKKAATHKEQFIEAGYKGPNLSQKYLDSSAPNITQRYTIELSATPDYYVNTQTREFSGDAILEKHRKDSSRQGKQTRSVFSYKSTRQTHRITINDERPKIPFNLSMESKTDDAGRYIEVVKTFKDAKPNETTKVPLQDTDIWVQDERQLFHVIKSLQENSEHKNIVFIEESTGEGCVFDFKLSEGKMPMPKGVTLTDTSGVTIVELQLSKDPRTADFLAKKATDSGSRGGTAGWFAGKVASKLAQWAPEKVTNAVAGGDGVQFYYNEQGHFLGLRGPVRGLKSDVIVYREDLAEASAD